MKICGMKSEYVRVTPLFVYMTKDPPPTLECSCAMESHRFAGATYPDEPAVRIGREVLRRFVDDFRALERDRRGEAILECRELRLAFWVTDQAGHVHLQAALTEHQSGGIHQVKVAFEVDPTSLPSILADLEELLAFPRSDPSSTGFRL